MSTNQKDTKSKSKLLLDLLNGQKIIRYFFKDQFKAAHVEILIDGHYEILDLENDFLKHLLREIYYTHYDDVLSDAAINECISIIKAKCFKGKEYTLSIRIAELDDEIYYDLCNDKREAIKITSEGWMKVDSTQIPCPLFRRTNNMKAQVEPAKRYEPSLIDHFIDLLNYKNPSFKLNEGSFKLLIKAYIVSIFFPNIARPILFAYGSAGSAKSTSQRLIKKLIDPAIKSDFSFPRKSEDFIQQQNNNYYIIYDNVSSMPDWLSDELCRAVTGGGNTKRKHYTNNDDFISDYKRCIAINGINQISSKPDLLSRLIIVNVDELDKSDRMTEKIIYEDLEKIIPGILNFIFNSISDILGYRKYGGDELKRKRGLPRLAEFALIGEIFSRCPGNDDDEFLKIYEQNESLQIEESIEKNDLAPIIVCLANTTENKVWRGTASELQKTLKYIAIKNDLDPQAIPRTPNKLSEKINILKSTLKRSGISITTNKDNNNFGARTIVIERTENLTMPIKKNESSLDNTYGINDDNAAEIKTNSIKSSELSSAIPYTKSIILDNHLNIEIDQDIDNKSTTNEMFNPPCNNKNTIESANNITQNITNVDLDELIVEYEDGSTLKIPSSQYTEEIKQLIVEEDYDKIKLLIKQY